MELSTQTLQIPLIERKSRPMFEYVENGEYILALYDTGALSPVWCAGLGMLKSVYPSYLL